MGEQERTAAIYCRISRDRVGAGLGVDRQRDDCRRLAEQLGVRVAATPYEDNDLSAYSGKPRPRYRALLADMRSGKVDVVLAWHTDRLHRSPVELEEYISLSEKHAVTTHTVKAGEVDLSTPSGRAVARTLGAWARYESEHRSERVSRALVQVAAGGGFLGGVRPFGYDSKGVGLVPDEVAAITEATAAILGGGSLRQIVTEWNRRGLRTTKADRVWTSNAVRDVLTRPRNAGLLEHRGQVVGPAGWPALVSEDQWRGAVAVLTDRARRTTPGNQPRWLGSGIYECSVCGDGMVVGTSGGHRRPSYKCRSAERGGARHVTRVAAVLDEYVSEVLIATLSLPDAADLFAAEEPVDVDVSALRVELAGIAANREALGRAVGEGAVTLAQFTAANDAARGRQEAIEAQLARLTRTDPVAAAVQADDPAEVWAGYELEQRREVLRRLARVVVHPSRSGRKADGTYFDPDSVEIIWRTG